MKEKPDKNRKELSELLRYTRGEMTQRQENAFQRKLQRDPFTAEAAEGLEILGPDQALKDISTLEKRLSSRISNRKRYIYYRIAASIAVLMIVSSIFIVVNRKESTKEVGGIPAPAVMSERSESKEVSIPEQETSGKDTETPAEPARTGTGGQKKAEVAAIEIPEETRKEPAIITEPAEIKGIAAEEQVLVAEKAEVQAAPAVVEKEAAAMEYVAADMDRKAAKAAAVPSAYRESVHVAPEPISGRNDFEKYLKENIRIPEMLAAGDSAIVEISITITSSGQIRSIRIIDSPGEEFSLEARRLIEEGPAWNPAKSGGVQVNDSVRLKILFRR